MSVHYNLLLSGLLAVCFMGAQTAAVQKPQATAVCVNEDFESSATGPVTASNQLNGWTLIAGYNGTVGAASVPTLSIYYPSGLNGQNACNLLGCCPMPPIASELISCAVPGGYIDNIIGNQYPIYSVFGSSSMLGSGAVNPQLQQPLLGSKVLRLNNAIASDYGIEKLSKTFSVTPGNSVFQLAYMAVVQRGHGCCDAAALQVKVINATSNTPLVCPAYSFAATTASCASNANNVTFYDVTGFLTPATPASTTVFSRWNIIGMDFTAYIGQAITIEIIASDCISADHYAYFYLDAQCGSMTIYGNGMLYDANTNVIIPACGNATVCAMDGMGPFSWAGPGVTIGQSIPSHTNICFTTSATAQYTLYMQPEGSCAPLARVLTTTIMPAPQLSSPPYQFDLCGNTQVQISPIVVGSTAGYNFSWQFPATATVSGVTTSVLITNAPGLYTVMVSSPSTSCTSSAQLTVGICVGINQNEIQEQFRVWPNPGNGMIIVYSESKTNNKVMELYDLLGKLIVRKEVDSEVIQIDIRDRSPGVYLLRIYSGKQTHYVKVLKE